MTVTIRPDTGIRAFVARLWDRWQEPVVRAVRTGIQAFLGVYTASILAREGVVELDSLVDVEVLEAALSAGIIAVVTFVQNGLESKRV